MRIRTVKPEFFADDDVADLSLSARLLFVGLLLVADREGRLEDRPVNEFEPQCLEPHAIA